MKSNTPIVGKLHFWPGFHFFSDAYLFQFYELSQIISINVRHNLETGPIFNLGSKALKQE
jgi:hypothetical protein